MMDDVELTVSNVTETALTAIIPEDVETGFITVSDGAQTFQTGLVFMITKEIEVSYDANLGMDVSSYDMGTLYSTAEEDGNSLKLQIDTFNHSLVMADNEAGSGSPVYGIGRVDKDSLELSAASTVESKALMSGILHSPDYEELSTRLDFLVTLSEFSELVQLVQGHFDEGSDFLDASDFETGLQVLLEAFIEAYVPETIPFSGEVILPENQNDIGYDYSLGFYSFRRNYPKDLENTRYEGLDRVIPVPGVKIPGRRGTPIQKIKMDSAPIKSSAFGEVIGPYLKGLKANPLDWSANLYELDINDPALFTPQLADQISESFWNYAYKRTTNEALDRVIVPAALVSSYGDIEAQMVAGIKDQHIPQFLKSVAPEAEPPTLKEDLTIPSELPGIYMI